MTTVAEVLASTLRSQQTEYFFCVTGGDAGLWFALRDAGISVINCRSEAGATYMADGYARATGGPAFVYGQAGPGAANVAAALADAYWAMSPVISLCSSTRLATRGKFEYQELDQLTMFEPVTRWRYAVSVPHDAHWAVRTAIRKATGTPSGPVHLEVPADLIDAETGSVDPGAAVPIAGRGYRNLVPDQATLEQIADKLLRARRPVILAGGGVVVSDACGALAALSDRLQIPVATSLGGKGAISETSDLSIGVIGRYSSPVANAIIDEADVVFVIGSRLGGLTTDSWRLFRQADIIRLDIAEDNLRGDYQESISALGDAQRTLEALLKMLGSAKFLAGEWIADIRERAAEWHAAQRSEQRCLDTAHGLHPGTVLDTLRDIARRDDIIVADTGYMAAWTASLYPVHAGMTYMRAAGSLGWSVPAAIGAALGAKDRRVVAVTGDGGFGYHLPEIETAVRWSIPVVVLILNNQSLAFEYHVQKNAKNGRFLPETTDYSTADYAMAARAFGANSASITDPTQLAAEIESALNCRNGPTVLDIRTTKELAAPVSNFRRI